MKLSFSLDSGRHYKLVTDVCKVCHQPTCNINVTRNPIPYEKPNGLHVSLADRLKGKQNV